MVLLTAGLLGLVEQEMVRVLTAGKLQPNVIITGVALLLLLLGTGVVTMRSMKFGPFHLTVRQLREEAEEDARWRTEEQKREEEAA